MNHLLLTAIYSVILNHCRTKLSFILFVIWMIYYQINYHKLEWKHYILIITIYLLTLCPYVLKNNCVIETHEKYVIASLNHQKVLIYTDEIYFENETIKTNAAIQPIESNSNFKSFDFSEYCKQQNIVGMIDKKEVEFFKKNSLKRRMFEKIHSYDEKTTSYLKKVFYQFDSEELVISTGLHFSNLNQLVKKAFSTIAGDSFSNVFASIICCLFGFLFPYKFALLRIVVGNLVFVCFKNYSPKERLGIQYLICMALDATSCFKISFLLPFGLSMIRNFTYHKHHRFICSKLFLIFYQFYTFGCCKPITILLFSFVRWLNSICLFLSLSKLVLPFSLFYQILMEIIEKLLSIMKLPVFYGKSPAWITILFLLFFIAYWNQKMKKSVICFYC